MQLNESRFAIVLCNTRITGTIAMMTNYTAV